MILSVPHHRSMLSRADFVKILASLTFAEGYLKNRQWIKGYSAVNYKREEVFIEDKTACFFDLYGMDLRSLILNTSSDAVIYTIQTLHRSARLFSKGKSRNVFLYNDDENTDLEGAAAMINFTRSLVTVDMNNAYPSRFESSNEMIIHTIAMMENELKSTEE